MQVIVLIYGIYLLIQLYYFPVDIKVLQTTFRMRTDMVSTGDIFSHRTLKHKNLYLIKNMQENFKLI